MPTPTPADLLKQGDLDAALAAVNQAVRNAPADAHQRLLLFQLNCVLSRWPKALDQLGVYEELVTDTDSRIRARLYRAVLHCEAFRAGVFAGTHTPLLFGEPEPWLGSLIESVRLFAQGQPEAAAVLRDQAFDAAPATAGTIDGRPFEWLADADTRLGPVLELHMEGKYYWVPFSRIRRISIEPPTDLCDLVFTPAQFKWTNGGEGAGFIPVRYISVGDAKPDSRCVLSRLTEWREHPGPFATGVGQRLFATDTEEVPLLETRTVDFKE